MVPRRIAVPLVASLALVPGTVLAQANGELDGSGSLAEFLLVMVIGTIATTILTLLIGAVVLVISQSYVRRVEERIYDQPVLTGAVGFGAIIGGFVALIAAMIVVALLLAVGVPEPFGLVLAIPFFGWMALLYIAPAICTIVVGSMLLRRFRDGESNLWLALVVGALVVGGLSLIPLVNIVIALVVLSLGLGAMVGVWWSGRREKGGSAGRETVSG